MLTSLLLLHLSSFLLPNDAAAFVVVVKNGVSSSRQQQQQCRRRLLSSRRRPHENIAAASSSAPEVRRSPSASRSENNHHQNALSTTLFSSRSSSHYVADNKPNVNRRRSSSQRNKRRQEQQQRQQPTRRRRKKKKTVRDRTRRETAALIRDVVRAAAEAGPVAGPARTLQAYRAVLQTVQDVALNNNNNASTVPAVLRALFERMGATYVKLGQFIASSPTLFPAEYVLEFQKCLDSTEPVPWSDIKAVIESELGGPASKHFASIEPAPLAAASIAQVHAAVLKDTGEHVVVKVQKPGIDASLKADLSFVYVAARVLEFLQPDWERTSLSAVAGDVRASMLEELDFVRESKNTMAFRAFLRENGLLHAATAPRVYADLTTRKVLTMERLYGVSLLDEDTVNTVTGSDSTVGADTIITALNVWSMSVTAMPWFHADVHAGNLMLLRDGRIGFIDFGIVGKISPEVFRAVSELSAALVAGDSVGMAEALCNMGAADHDVDTVQFGRDLEQLLSRMDQVQPDLTAVTTTTASSSSTTVQVNVNEQEITDLLLDMVRVTEDNGLKLPREFGLLVKQSLYFDRYLKVLAPNVDVMNDTRVMIGGQSRNKQNKQPQPQSGDADAADSSSSRSRRNRRRAGTGTAAGGGKGGGGSSSPSRQRPRQEDVIIDV